MPRSTKSKALAELRARRNGLSAVSRTEEYEVKEDDVYEKVDESEYKELVQRRREREDFVVDDGKSTKGPVHSLLSLFFLLILHTANRRSGVP